MDNRDRVEGPDTHDSSPVVRVNGLVTTFSAGESVADLISRLSLSVKGTAVALNDVVLPRSQWGSTELTRQDRLEVLAPQAGG